MTKASLNADNSKQITLPAFSSEPVVLVVEEEAAIREMLFLVLRQNGFTVHLARNGEEAIMMFSPLQWEVDVVLLDWGMDGMDGPQTLAVLREMNPKIACCFMSGGAAAMHERETPVLPKPFTITMLIEELRSLVH